MAAATDALKLPSLLGVTLRRSLVVGRISLIIGSVMVAFCSAAFGFGGSLFTNIGTFEDDVSEDSSLVEHRSDPYSSRCSTAVP
ncbi:MAG: hypothetical protein WAN87_10245 [Thermoplasmata archaeon]